MTEVDTTPTGEQPRGAASANVALPTFDDVYRAEYPSMLRLAISLVDRRAEAEQVVQDAFLGLFRRFDDVERPAAYVRTSVANGARRVLRRRYRARRLVVPDAEVTELGADHTLDAVRRLSPDHRLLVTLRYHQQLTDAEIAAELDLPIGTVKSRLHRALARLREDLS